jgi:hypothetical protein
MAFEPKPQEAYNACLLARLPGPCASRALRLARSPDPAPYSGNASPEPPNSLGKSLSFGRPSRMRSTVSW